MQLRGDQPRFFATDLTNFLSCRHLTSVERLAAHGLTKRPYFDDPMLELLRERGRAHESAYVDHLREAGLQVVEIDRNDPDAGEATLRAMRAGVDVVVRGRLAHGSWAGWADVLLRVPGRSALAAWMYEPVETKLATETRGATLIQLCVYADLLSNAQGASPETLRVVTPGCQFQPERHRFAEFRAYFELMKRQFEAATQTELPSAVETASPYPDPVSHCNVCNWFQLCERRRTADDHISLVAGIQRAQRKELATWGVTTLTSLAQLPQPLPRKPSRGSGG